MRARARIASTNSELFHLEYLVDLTREPRIPRTKGNAERWSALAEVQEGKAIRKLRERGEASQPLGLENQVEEIKLRRGEARRGERLEATIQSRHDSD